MQIKILYSFNNNSTTFLSRSSQLYPVQTVDVPIQSSLGETPGMITLGAFELKNCIQQLLETNSENFKLQSEDYAVYYKDITEQPDEPFVSNGVFSSLLSSNESCLIPGRVCQNVSANILFGKKGNSASLTLEIRLKLHTIEAAQSATASATTTTAAATTTTMAAMRNSSQQQRQPRPQQVSRHHPLHTTHTTLQVERKRPYDALSSSVSSFIPAAKATRTLSLPSYANIHDIQQADRNPTLRYNRENVENRFKSASFYRDKVVFDKGEKRQKRYPNVSQPPHSQPKSSSFTSSQLLPQRAVRTRSMFVNTPTMASSPINEETYSSDDPEYKAGEDQKTHIEEEEEEEEEDGEGEDGEEEEDEDDEDYDATSPYTPQQPPFVNKETPPELPEDLDSKRTHTISSSKLPENHGLVCINSCCRTQTSIAWKYFETEYKPHFSALIRATEFDKKHYEGMHGPLCNACFLFYKNKGFMRPEHVVRKYNQQQRYNQKLRMRNSKEEEEADHLTRSALSTIASSKKNLASSPATFPTPSHTPSTINQVIQNKYHSGNNHFHMNPTPTGQTPEYNDLMNQLNVYGGPSTDIDPLPGATPPMIAVKSNTRVINIGVDDLDAKKATKLNTRVINIANDEDENKENCPPQTINTINNKNAATTTTTTAASSATAKEFAEFDAMLQSIHEDANTNWMNFFSQPTPRDQNSPNSKTPVDQNPSVNIKRRPNTSSSSSASSRQSRNDKSLVNMPSSPYLSTQLHSDEAVGGDGDAGIDDDAEINEELKQLVDRSTYKAFNNSTPDKANRTDTTNSLLNWQHNTNNANASNKNLASTPSTDFFSNDDAVKLDLAVEDNKEKATIT
ncbi:hypothetical protein KGF56_003852 [Candida oxycetoniae]|uniref:GATA-type domain-containing protein n=1 Tax=Candida oxycetoniae TaxID=497107 RepID=A0AAI9WWT0_9ASCO|nr:uncharacterized protein KGF56_003852 [Candida oxycetoniae]KAI3403264.2 hypothetical protein KGF56_003852 [Candida oxycetoniae]